MYTEIKKCRICGNTNLISILDLGLHYLTGVFPEEDEEIPKVPVQLVKCEGASGCGLVQLKHTVKLNLMYGDNYGYRSGLNSSMVKHLQNLVEKIKEFPELKLEAGDVVVDCGSNDGTLLKSYDTKYNLIGIDPTGSKFKEYYPRHIKLVPDFFSKENYYKVCTQKCKIFTSISMLYDLPDPQLFFNDVAEILHPEGVWLFEQSYLHSMIKHNTWDTIVSEHLEYYGLNQIKTLLTKAKLVIRDVELTNTNGGSFLVIASHPPTIEDNKNKQKIETMLQEERQDMEYFLSFKDQVQHTATDLFNLLKKLKREGKLVIGLGASTKGNCLLQYCNITKDLLPFIAEVNTEKFGKVTPGTKIPIIAEDAAEKLDPDYYLVLPWHFKSGFLKSKKHFLERGGKLIFPLPKVEIISK